MAELIIDLSGKGGLARGFHGDTDMITPQPQLRITKTQNDLVGGMFNPDLRDGYLAPVTTNSTSLTFDTSPTTILGSVEYDHLDDDVYWADRLNNLFKGDSLTDTSLSLHLTLEDDYYTNQKFDEIHDLQVYVIDGVRQMFIVGKGMPEGQGPTRIIATTDVTDIYVSVTVSTPPATTTVPAVVANTRDFTGTSSLTHTKSFTVPSGTDRVLIVVSMWTSNATHDDITWGGAAMTRIRGTSGGPSAVVYMLFNPTAATANIVSTWDTSVGEKVLYAYVLDNAHQTLEPDADSARDLSPDTNAIIVTPNFVDINQHLMTMAFSDREMTRVDLGTTYYDTTNTWGSDLMGEINDVAYGLQVAVSSLPLTTSLGGSDASWLATNALGGFFQTLDSDYAFMRTADNGFAYLFADNHVHKIDGTVTGGTNGTVTKNVLLFPEHFRITDAIDYRSRLYIAVHQYPVDIATTTLDTYIGECGIYVWNRISTQLSSADYIQLPGVREIKRIYASPDGQLKLLVIADDGQVQVRQFGYNDSGGVVFSTGNTFGIGAFPQFPDGLTAAGDRTMWIGNDGKVYSERAEMITQLFQVKAPGTTSATLATNIETGAVFYGSGDETADAGYRSNKQALTFSYVDSSTQYLKKIYPFDLKDGSNAAQAQAQGDVYSGVNLIPMTSDVRNIRVYNAPTESSGSTVIATVKVYFNQSTTASMPSGMTKSITMDEGKRGYVDFKINKQYINSVQIEVEWSTSIDLGGDTYLPSVAVITHEPTDTQSPDNG